MNVAVVNLNRLLDESKRGRTLSQRLKVTLDKWQKQILELETKLEKTRSELKRAPPNLPAESLFKMQRDLRMGEMEHRHAQELSRFELEAQREHARNSVLRELEPLLAEVATQKSLSLVLTIPSREVLFAAQALDITEELLQRYDQLAKG